MSYKRKHKKQIGQIAQTLGTNSFQSRVVLFIIQHGNKIPVWLQNAIFKLIGSKITVRVQ